ncbi:MAG: hypothetical protein Q6373_011530 [Candidatus Sigynarchaeota archaeon]
MRRSIVGEWLQRRAAKHRPEAKLAKWKIMQNVGIFFLIIGISLVIVPLFLPFILLRAMIFGMGIPLLIIGFIFTIVFYIKITELKRLNPGLISAREQIAGRRVAQRIPRARSSLQQEQLNKLKALLKVSERIKIDDIASVLGTSRKDTIDKLLLLSKSVNFQINEDVVIIEKGQTDLLISELDKQFGEWETKEKTKSGKI